jgi:hypothetical protein
VAGKIGGDAAELPQLADQMTIEEAPGGVAVAEQDRPSFAFIDVVEAVEPA